MKKTIGIYGIQDCAPSSYPQYVHDHNFAVMQNGEVERFYQQERYTRRKRDNTLFSNFTEVLRKYKLIGGEPNVVFTDNVVGRSFISADGQIRFEAPLRNELSYDIEEGKLWWFGKQTKAYVVNHELAHIGTCLPFFGDFKENSLLVHYDGGASYSNFSAWVYKDGVLNHIEHHWDFKWISSLFNANALIFSIIGAKRFDQNSVPGKLMGFASFGKYSKKIHEWLVLNNWFEDIWKRKSIFFDKAKLELGVEINSWDQKHELLQNIAATVQHVFTVTLLEKLELLKNDTQTEYLYYSGGSALNIVANTAIVNSNLFKDVFIPPCTEDSGLGLGAAAFFEWKNGNSINIHSAYLNNIDSTEVYNHDDQTIEKLASEIANGKVYGLCNGFGESGPRALGNRSLIARADRKSLFKKVSVDIKKREWYRPVAPIMLEEDAKFFTGLDRIHQLSKFMLLDFDIIPSKQSLLEGAVHVDGTARIQTLYKRSDNPFVYDLLIHLRNNYGINALINTSFNQQGEPIVHNASDAKESAERMELDGVIIQGELYEF